MTTSTRRLAWLAFFNVMLAIPVGMVLWPAAYSSPRDEARRWTSNLSPQALTRAVSTIEDYPASYRKEILRLLSPSQRAEVFKTRLSHFRNTDRTLSAEARNALLAAERMLTTELFVSRPSNEQLTQITQVADNLRRILGKDVTARLVTFGPPEGRPRSWNLPSLLVTLRGKLVAQARDRECDCSTESDYCSSPYQCSNALGCIIDDYWPMCGSFYMYTCNGNCFN
jgi:hypothetical protein